jgi:ribonucleotide monophosphatase NagD (HAD superfamily)
LYRLFDEDEVDLNKNQLHENDLNYYKKILIKHISKTLVCTNPDLVVHRGKQRRVIALAMLLKIFEELGGKVIYYGKPHEENI